MDTHPGKRRYAWSQMQRELGPGVLKPGKRDGAGRIGPRDAGIGLFWRKDFAGCVSTMMFLSLARYMRCIFTLVCWWDNDMQKVKVRGFSVSFDGFAAGPRQSLECPLGANGPDLFQWFFPTKTFYQMVGKDGGDTGPDDDFARRAMDGFGAFILGRNMFGPIRGAWPDDEWKGWWGDNPPYHAPTFVLTHHARAPIEMLGGTTFHFVTSGIEDALRQARKAAGPGDVKIGGGAETVRQYVQAGHVDEINLAFAPVALGRGEPLFKGLDLRALGYRTVEHVHTARATHIVLAK